MVNKVTWEISQSQDLVQTWTSSLTYIRLFVYTCLWWIGKSLADIYIVYKIINYHCLTKFSCPLTDPELFKINLPFQNLNFSTKTTFNMPVADVFIEL